MKSPEKPAASSVSSRTGLPPTPCVPSRKAEPMELIGSPLQLASAVFVNLVGLLLAIRAGKRLGVRKGWAMMLYAWHSLFCLMYATYAVENGAEDRKSTRLNSS